MSTVDFENPGIETKVASNDKQLFFWLLLLVTVGSVLFVPFFSPLREASSGVDNIFNFVLVFSTMHVALTLYFYVDSTYASKLSENKLFYYFLPIAVLVISGLSVQQLGYTGKKYLFVFYHAWLLFHYGRQNFGILSFVASSTQTGRPLLTERLALHFAPIGGILGAHAMIDDFKNTVAGPFLNISVSIGLLFTAAAAICAGIAAIHHIRNKAALWRPLFTLLLPLFYVPTFLFDDYLRAITSYALAHALQYFVFMFFLATGDQRNSPNKSIVILSACAMIGWGVVLLSRERPFWHSLSPELDLFMVGAALGLIMCHFIVDAGVWRLRNKWFREESFSRFSFLFSKD